MSGVSGELEREKRDNLSVVTAGLPWDSRMFSGDSVTGTDVGW